MGKEKYFDNVVIGIDHGFNNMKTAHCCFPTALGTINTQPDRLAGILQYDGEIYDENGPSLNYIDNADKTTNEDFYILTLIALAKELKYRELNKVNVTLTTGLPQRWYEKQKDSFKQYLMKRPELKFNYEGDSYHVRINDVKVYTQGYAAFMISPNILKNLTIECVIVDIGGGTVDIIRVINGAIKNGIDGSKIDTRASLWLINNIQEVIETELCKTISPSVIISYMQNGNKNEKPKNKYEEIMQREFANYSDMIFRMLKEYRINTDLIPVIFIGGGSCVIKNFGNYPESTQFISDIKANAKGYEHIYDILG